MARPMSATGRAHHASARAGARLRRQLTIADEHRRPLASGSSPTRSWFQRAVFYEIHVRAFADGNDDGIGDFVGLDRAPRLPAVARRRLHLAAADVRRRRCATAATTSPTSTPCTPTTAPSTTSPRSSTPAHQRGIRVIADLVMNHTSIDHPWFQESRASPDSPKRDWYVWSDTDDRYADARIIFVDTESSNWTWDPRGRAVLLAPLLLAPARPQLRQPRGRRRDARGDARSGSTSGSTASASTRCPTCSSATGTNCENLPETHEYLKRVRKESTREYPDRVLLAEANQWPARRRRVLRRRRRVPHGVPLPGDAADLHGDATRRGAADHRHPRTDAGDPGRTRSGACSCATTTSSRSRWSPTRSATTCTRSTPKTR